MGLGSLDLGELELSELDSGELDLGGMELDIVGPGMAAGMSMMEGKVDWDMSKVGKRGESRKYEWVGSARSTS